MRNFVLFLLFCLAFVFPSYTLAQVQHLCEWDVIDGCIPDYVTPSDPTYCPVGYEFNTEACALFSQSNCGSAPVSCKAINVGDDNVKCYPASGEIFTLRIKKQKNLFFEANGCNTTNPATVNYYVKIFRIQIPTNVHLFTVELNKNASGTLVNDPAFRLANPGVYMGLLYGNEKNNPAAQEVYIAKVGFLINEEGEAGQDPEPIVTKAEIATCDGDYSIRTAFGCIDFSSFNSLPVFLVNFGIGVGGGISLVMTAYAGFLVMTSQGDPQRLQHGRELMFSAISGLLIIIFSTLILRSIGVGILGIF